MYLHLLKVHYVVLENTSESEEKEFHWLICFYLFFLK